MNEYPELVSLCNIFLQNESHPSRRAHTEEAMQKMYTALRKRMYPMQKMYTGYSCGPVTLAQPIDRLTAEQVRELKNLLYSIISECVEHENKVNPPPHLAPLGVSVSETINAGDRMK